MSRKQNKPKKKNSSLWTPFRLVTPLDQDKKPVPLNEGERYVQNSFYTVFVKEMEPEKGAEGAVQLAIKRRDGKAIREWKHLQRIKNEVVGADREAAEIFPPEELLGKLDHEHHLFVTPVGVSSIYVYEEKLRRENVSAWKALRGEKKE